MRRRKIGPAHTLGYDAENRLTSVSGGHASFLYDADGARVKAVFGSGDSASITSYVSKLVEVSPIYREDFSDGQAQGWTASSGAWAVTTGGYRQSGTANNTNAYRAQTQNQLLVYRWQATFTSGVNAGMYLLASATTGAERGNSYRVWQDATSVKIYESTGNTATQRANVQRAVRQFGGVGGGEVLPGGWSADCAAQERCGELPVRGSPGQHQRDGGRDRGAHGGVVVQAVG
ncbi:hypothetical protein [Candidatus Amarolinea dominans]|uniref:hypothetical protein n=1 Tax=Candidatus Amarolinea dominans TaxID=3140696 RepID=UPI00313689AF|nr:hypothetical protein [Anaerolineae bacterium]